MKEKLKAELIDIIIVSIVILMDVVTISYYLCLSFVIMLGLSILEYYSLKTFYVLEFCLNDHTRYFMTNYEVSIMIILFIATFKRSLIFFKRI